VRIGRVGADDQDDIGMIDGGEILRAGRCAERDAEPIAGRRVAHAGTGIDIIVAESRAHQFLNQIGFFVGAAGGGDSADRIDTVGGLQAVEFRGGMVHCLLPRHFAPWVGYLCAHHGFRDAVPVGRVAVGETALDAAMA